MPDPVAPPPVYTAAPATAATDLGPPRPAVSPTDVFAGNTSGEFSTQVDANNLGGAGLWTVNNGYATTVNAMVQRLYRLSPAEITQLQIALYRAGKYDDQVYRQLLSPTWGTADETTQQAYYYLLLDAARNPDKTISTLLKESVSTNRDRLAQLQTNGKVAYVGPEVVELGNYSLTDPAALRAMYRAAGASLIGRDLTDDEQNAFASAIRAEQDAQGQAAQGQQLSAAQERTNQRLANAQRDAKDAAGPEATDEEVTAFTRSLLDTVVDPASAVGVLQNTGLNRYGIDAETLRQWAAEARAQGAGIPSLSSPQDVDMVVQWHVNRLYKTFGGDWQSVATNMLADIDASIAGTNKALPSAASPTADPLATPNRRQAGFDASGRLLRPDQMPNPPTPGFDPSGRLMRPDRMSTPADPNAGAQANLMSADLGGYGTPPPRTSSLSGLAAQVVAAMGQALGGRAGPAGAQTSAPAPIAVGGGPVEQINAQARAEEQIRREHPGDVFDFSMLQKLNAFDTMLGGAR